MTVCLSCGHVTPGAGGLFCGHCGAGLGHKLCENKHTNPLGAAVQTCSTCGSPDLIEGARVLRLHWLPALLAGIVAVFAWKTLLAHAGPVLNAVSTATLAAAAFLLNTTPGRLVSAGREAWAVFLLAWLSGEAMRLLPNRGGWIGSWLRGLPLLALRIGTRLAVRSARLSLSLARRAVFGAPARLPRVGGSGGFANGGEGAGAAGETRGKR